MNGIEPNLNPIDLARQNGQPVIIINNNNNSPTPYAYQHQPLVTTQHGSNSVPPAAVPITKIESVKLLNATTVKWAVVVAMGIFILQPVARTTWGFAGSTFKFFDTIKQNLENIIPKKVGFNSGGNADDLALLTQGKALRKGRSVAGRSITSDMRSLRKYGLHNAMDFAYSGKVYMPLDGKVVRVIPNIGDCGKGVELIFNADPSIRSIMCHFSTISVGLGDLPEGSTIGVTGSTGHSTGTHLHWALFRTQPNGSKKYLPIGADLAAKAIAPRSEG